MQTLHSRSELVALIEKLASDIISLIITPLLSPQSAYKYLEGNSMSWSMQRQPLTEFPDASLQSSPRLLQLIESQILSEAPESSSISSCFSKKLVPTLIQMTTKHMRHLLPSRLKKPISSEALSVLATLSQRGKDLYDALLQGDYLHQDLRDEGEELLQWSKDIHRHFMKNLATIRRRRARELLLNEAEGGWTAVTVDFDDESEAIQATLSNNAMLQKDFENGLDNNVQLQESVEDDWAKWDTEEPSIEASDLIRTSSTNAGKQRQKKSALGGRRVIRPQDELGSGPFPEVGNGDDVSWGFDDHISAEGSNTKSQYDALMKGLDEEEDVDEDAWGLTEEEKVERAAKRASMRGDMTSAFQAYQAKQDKQAENAPLAVPEETYEDGVDDQEDAWGLSAQEQEAIKKKRQSMLPPSANFTSALLSQGETGTDADDDDAWGLNDEGQEAIAQKRESMILPPIAGTMNPSLAEKDKSEYHPGVKQEAGTSELDSSSQIDTSSLVDVSSELSQDTATQKHDKDDEEDAWGFDRSPTKATADEYPATTIIESDVDLPERTSTSSERGDIHSGTPKTSATSSSFTRTLQPLDMDGDDSLAAVEQREGAPIEDAWDLQDEVASVSEGAGTGDSRGGKSSGSGEKLSDTTTEPWEEVSASAASLPIEEATAPVSASSIGDWGWTEDDAVPAASLGAVTGAAAAITLQSSRSASRTRSPLPTNSASPRKQQSPRSRQAALRGSQDTSIGRSSSEGRSPAPKVNPIHRKEKAIISQRSVDLIELIKDVFSDIEAIVDEGHNELLPTSYLINTINDVLDMHRALLPVGHAETLATVPSLGMQFANDCKYISKELMDMQVLWKSILVKIGHNDGNVILDLGKQAQLTMELGKRSFDGQLLLQHKILLDCLLEARGFTSTHEESQFSACQRSLKQVEFVLKQLQYAWKSVLTKSSYLSAMGALVDAVLRKVLMYIEAIEDISEVESEKLASLIKTLGQLEFLFREEGQKEDEQSVVALYVPSWFKASYLTEILTGSLVDIEFLYFEAGALVDYSKAEVISLIRSLFADTPKRARLIERIQSS